jgi:hypothetical protein
MENNGFLAEITKEEIEEIKDEYDDDAHLLTHFFLDLFRKKYNDIIDAFIDANIGADDLKALENFNKDQVTFYRYWALHIEVEHGGFIGLIQHGWAAMIFDSTLSEDIKLWGLEKTSEIIEKAKPIYKKYQKDIEKDFEGYEFAELYEKITEFTPVEDEYYDTNDSENEKAKEYIETHLNNFAIII